jgi:predicted ATP-dependent endonuclease of OLD family
MIQSLEVKGLNNRDDGNFNLHFHEDLNIFTGANGSGKTTLLKLIWYLISGHLEQIFPEIPFHHLLIETDSFSLTLSRSKPDKVEFSWEFPEEKKQQQTMTIDSETGTIDRKDVDKINELEKRIARTMKSSLFFPTFRRIEGVFSEIPRNTNDSAVRFLGSAAEMLQVSMSRFSSEVSTNEHKFIASISTDDIGDLLTQKYADIYEEISALQSQLLDDISRKIQDASDSGNVPETPQDAPAVLDDIKQVNEKRDLLRKPFSVLSELTQNILQYRAIHVTGRLALGEETDSVTLGEKANEGTLEEAKEAISSDKLSAGEKQMLSFLCYNAFSDNMPIFIDEPELSLHVDWQRLLFPTLLKQGQKNQFFVATHSPFIYAKYPDKEFLLNDNRGGS